MSYRIVYRRRVSVVGSWGTVAGVRANERVILGGCNEKIRMY